MRAGTLIHRLTIQRWTPDVDPKWGLSPAWTDIETIWGCVTPKSGTEKPDGDGVQASVTHEVSVRYRSDLTSKDRLVFQNRTFDIVSILNVDELNVQLLIDAREHPIETAPTEGDAP